MVLIYYAPVCFTWLHFTDNKEKGVANARGKVVELVEKWLNWLYSILGRFSTGFKKLLQKYALNICYLNSGWGSFSKSKLQSSLGIMQAWFPKGKLICGPGSCVLPRTCWFSKPGLSFLCHCHVDWFPIVGKVFRVSLWTNLLVLPYSQCSWKNYIFMSLTFLLCYWWVWVY